MLLPLQGALLIAIILRALPWALLCIIGCTSAIQASSIAFDLHDNSARFGTKSETLVIIIYIAPIHIQQECICSFLSAKQKKMATAHLFKSKRISVLCEKNM